MDFFTILVFCVTVLVFLYISGKFTNPCNVPGPIDLPFIGTPALISTSSPDRINAIKRLRKKYGDIFRLKAGQYNIVFICGYKLFQEWFQKNGLAFINRPNWLPSIKDTSSNGQNGIAWSNGPRWKAIRRFTMQSLRDLGVGKTEVTERIMEEVTSVIQLLEKSNNQPICLKKHMTIASSNIINSVIFGFRHPSDSEKLQDLIEHVDAVFQQNIFLSPDSLMPWLRIFYKNKYKSFIKHVDAIKSYIDEQINEHRASFDKNNIRDFVDLYLLSEQESEKCAGINKEEFYITILDLFLAGTDTTSTTLYWAFLFIVASPDVQQKCQEEIDSMVGDGRMVQLSDRKNMKYIEATLMEVQRLSNVAGGTLPRTPSEDITINGYTIPKGSIVLGLFVTIHLDGSCFRDPDTFNPERFLENDGNSSSKEFLMPFSLGPRACPGESLANTELFLMFSNILQRFKLEKVGDVDLQHVAGFTTSPKPYKLKATARQ